MKVPQEKLGKEWRKETGEEKEAKSKSTKPGKVLLWSYQPDDTGKLCSINYASKFLLTGGQN